MRDEYYLDGLNCEPYSFDAACRQLNREYQKNKNKNEIKSHHYIISFDPRDNTENCLTGKRAQELGLEYAKANFPGHQALVCTHMDGHNGSGNIHVHIVINSLRKLDVPQQPFMERPIDSKAGYKHHVTNEYLKHLQKSLMDLCRREFLHQVDLLSPSRTGVTEAEYWAQRRLDEKKQKIETEGFTSNPTKFQTQKQLIRDAVAAAREKAISYEDFQDILQDEYNIFVKTQRGRYSYLPPERNKFISEHSLGESCKRECLEEFFVQNAEKNLRYKEEPILIFMTRTRLRLVVDLQENIKAQENLAYALKVKISNLQKMAETLVWVQENNINDLTELNDLCKTAQANAQAAYERLSQAEDGLYKTNEQIHYAGQYLSTKDVQQQFTKAIFKKKFRAEHSKELDAYAESVKYFREENDGKLPSLKSLKKRKEELTKEIAERKKAYAPLREESRRLEIASDNVYSIFRKTDEMKSDLAWKREWEARVREKARQEQARQEQRERQPKRKKRSYDMSL
nr:relaxase/mobilization nuclease domain-containing protein [Faecalibacterium prausnitzii]